MIISGIYSITQLSTGKRYIGSSVHIKRRWVSHTSALNRNLNSNPHLQNSWNKSGKDDFLFEIIEDSIPENLLEDKENEYIVKFEIADKDTNIFNSEKGFNMFWAGREGCSHGNAPRGKNHYSYGKQGLRKGAKMPDWFREEHSKRMTGAPGRHCMPHSEESKQKMSNKLKGKPWTEARRAAQNKRTLGV